MSKSRVTYLTKVENGMDLTQILRYAEIQTHHHFKVLELHKQGKLYQG